MVQLLHQKSLKLLQQEAPLFFFCLRHPTALSQSPPFTPLFRFLQNAAKLRTVLPLSPSLDLKLHLLRQENFSPSEVKMLQDDPYFLAASFERVYSFISFLRAKGIVGSLACRPIMLSYKVERLETKCKFFEDLGITPRGLERLLSNANNRSVLGIAMKTLQKRIDFLERIALNKQDIVKIVYWFPNILFMNLERKMDATMTFFERLGMVKDDFLRVVRFQPKIFGLFTDAKQRSGFVRGLGLDIGTWAGARAFALGVSYRPEVLLSKWEFLKRQGFSEADVHYMVMAQPQILAMSEDSLKRKIDHAKNLLNGLDIGTRKGARVFKAWATTKPEVLLSKWEFLKRQGFSEPEVQSMMMAQPEILARREGSLKRKIDYASKVLNRDLQELAKFPIYFSLSLENRVIPRFTFLNELKEKGELVKKFRLNSLLSPSNEVFEKRFANGYREWKAGYNTKEAKEG